MATSFNFEDNMKALKEIFSKSGNLSSKRVFGGMGLLIVFGCYIYSMISVTELPDCTEFIVATCASLLGVDAVVGAIKSKQE